MAKYSKCPRCGHGAGGGIIFRGGFFAVFECKKCRTQYCYRCRGTNEGRKCPECDSREYATAGECWPE